MAEQSSMVVLLRACVMLLCLIMIPIAALFGTAIPNVVKALQAGRLPTLAELRGPAAPGNPSPFNPFQSGPLPGGPLQSNPALPIARSGGTDVARTTPGGAGDNVAPLWTGPGPSNNVAGDGVIGVGARPTPSVAVAGAAGVIPVNYNGPLENRIAGAGAPAQASAGTNHPASPDRSAASSAALTIPAGTDPFTYVQDRLRRLGATYYLLESWGDRKQEYRFYCKMAVGGNTEYTKAFYWVDGDPQRAMMHVLQEVEGWHSGG